MHYPPPSVKDTIPASSPKAQTPGRDAEQPKGAHMLACRQRVGIATLALRGSSPCPAARIVPHNQAIPACWQAPKALAQGLPFLLVHRESIAEMPGTRARWSHVMRDAASTLGPTMAAAQQASASDPMLGRLHFKAVGKLDR